jgi:general secretion pathway protein E
VTTLADDAPPPARDLRDAASGVLARRLSSRYLEQHGVLPLGVDDDGKLVLAVGAPPADTVLDELSRVYARPIRVVEHPLGEIQAALLTAERESASVATAAGGDAGADDQPLDDLRALAAQEPVIRLVNVTLLDALRERASDVHFEPLAKELRIRYRLDGVLREKTRVGPQYQAAVVSRIKIMAGLDIAERRMPQDGRIRVTLGGRDVDLRVSTLPGLHGEGIVLRLLDAGQAAPDLATLGMPTQLRAEMERLISRVGGLVLVTGPTGSGKTTTLYAALARLNAQSVKIVTVEDPVEYRMDGVTQVPVNLRAGMGFASALRSILRHDPDIIMVGELRDAETATIAIQAALTGHLVLATLHTTDAVGAVTRLVDMGIDAYLVAATLQGALAQRLVRVLCDSCATPRAVSAAEGVRWGAGAAAPRAARGCEVCAGTGYRGRRGIYELFVPDDASRALVISGAPVSALRDHAQARGHVPLKEEGWRLVREGITTPEELLRATGEADA